MTQSAIIGEETPHDPKRVKAFADFFKRYMSVSAIVTAALPIPVTSLQLIPTYTNHTRLLSVYTTLFCFLVLSFVFYRRHDLARLMFSDFFESPPSDHEIRRRLGARVVNGAPALLIVASLACLFFYHFTLEQSLMATPAQYAGGEPPSLQASLGERREWYLLNTLPSPFASVTLIALYLGLFVFAESAFVLMAVKEYLQDVLRLSDMEIVRGERSGYAELA